MVRKRACRQKEPGDEAALRRPLPDAERRKLYGGAACSLPVLAGQTALKERDGLQAAPIWFLVRIASDADFSKSRGR